jgi:hypothetical protein
MRPRGSRMRCVAASTIGPNDALIVHRMVRAQTPEELAAERGHLPDGSEAWKAAVQEAARELRWI